MPLILLRVVCGTGDVIETFIPVIVFTNVDFPADGLPMTDTVADFMAMIITENSGALNASPIAAIIQAMENEKNEYKPDPGLSEKLLKTRTILISGEINKDRADEFARQILVLDSESQDPIYVYINSPGGDVDSGFAIYDMIRFVSSPVTIIGMGLVASAAALIFLAVPAERRVGLPDSTYLIHQPLSQLRGVAIDVAIYADKIEALRHKLDRVIAEAVGKTVDEVAKDTERDCWMTADEALSYGLLSRIVKSKSEI